MELFCELFNDDVEYLYCQREYLRQGLFSPLGGAGGEFDVFGVADQCGEKQQTVGDVLGTLGQVLADKGIVKAELIGEDAHELQAQAARLARRIAVLERGRVIRMGSPEEVLNAQRAD